jgi:hypothetical protein
MASPTTVLTPRTHTKEIPLWLSLVDDAFEGGILACLAITDALDPEVCIEQHLYETACDELSNHGFLLRQSPVNEDEDFTDMLDDFLPLNNTLKVTVDDPTPWDDRYQHIAALDKRPREYHPDGTLKKAVIPGMTIEKFTTKSAVTARGTNEVGGSKD